MSFFIPCGFILPFGRDIISGMTDNKFSISDKLPEKLISAFGTAALAAVFALWCARSGYGAVGYTAAVISVLAMLVLCLRFVPSFCAFLRDGGDCNCDAVPQAEGGICAEIFAFILLWDGFILILGFILRRIFGYCEDAGSYLNFWLCTDSQHYMDIARDWYLSDGNMDRLVQLVFLPGYPIAVRILSYISGSCLSAGFIISGVCFAGSGVMLYKLLRFDMSGSRALRAVKFFALCPAAFFFAAPMSESLFILCTLSCLYLVRRGRVFTGSILGAYAAFTRSLGIILIVPVFLELVHRRAKVREYLAIIIIPLGFAAYCLVNYAVSGDAFKFTEYQSEHWGQQLGWFFNTAAYQTENAVSCFSSNAPYFWGLWLPNLLAQIFSFAVIIAAARKLRASYTAYFIAYFAVAIGATWLLSAPRYLAAMISLPAAIGAFNLRPRSEKILLALSAAFLLAYFSAFLLRWQVW